MYSIKCSNVIYMYKVFGNRMFVLRYLVSLSRSRFLRQQDRDANKDCYPSLHYPEVYLLEGGYKVFYEQLKVSLKRKGNSNKHLIFIKCRLKQRPCFRLVKIGLFSLAIGYLLSGIQIRTMIFNCTKKINRKSPSWSVAFDNDMVVLSMKELIKHFLHLPQL